MDEKEILLEKIKLYAEYLAFSERLIAESIFINGLYMKSWLRERSKIHKLIAEELFKEIEGLI